MADKKAPAKKAKPKKDERTQRERFEQFAREHGATEDVLDKAISNLTKEAKKPKTN